MHTVLKHWNFTIHIKKNISYVGMFVAKVDIWKLFLKQLDFYEAENSLSLVGISYAGDRNCYI